MIDGLTGLYNRAWLNDLLPTMITTAHGSNSPLALIMIDLDHFKRFNDSHGHLAGDQALRAAAQVLSGALRPTDFAVRYGGEEMMVLLPETSELLAVLVGERLCARMRETMIFPDMRQPLPHITASVGVAVLGRLRHHLLLDAVGHLGVVVELPAEAAATLGDRPQFRGVVEHLGLRNLRLEVLQPIGRVHPQHVPALGGDLSHHVAHELVGHHDVDLEDRLEEGRLRRVEGPLQGL